MGLLIQRSDKKIVKEIKAINSKVISITNRVTTLEENIINVQLKGEVFDANVDVQLHSDDFGIIDWQSSTKSLRYNPKTGWGWHDGVAMKIDGNSSIIRANADDRSSTNNQFFYFTTGGNRDSNFDLENYGAYFMGTIIKEGFNGSYPSYKVEVLMGNTGSGAFLLTKLKNNI